MKLLFPQLSNHEFEAVLINTAGGITGGDLFDINAQVGGGANLTLTTQAAERVYRAQGLERGMVRTHLRVEDGASLQWLPQELILFDQSALHRRLEVSLAKTARLVLVEPIVFGRAAMGETLRDIHFQDRIRVTRDGVPIYIDGVNLDGNAASHLARKAIAAGAGAMASLVVATPDASAHLDAVRALLPKTAGVSMIADDVMVLRLLARDSFVLRQSLVPVLKHLTQSTLPKSWSL